MTTEMTLNEIRAKGFAALARELGPTGYVRFLQQFQLGSGDYTSERQQAIANLSLDQIRQALASSRTQR
jgi:hypothetical protein